MFSWGNKWTEDGIILSMPRGLRRLIMMEREHMAAIFRGIEERLGLSIDHIIIDAKRRDAKVYVQDVLPVFLGRLLRLAPLRRFGYLAMVQQASLIGLGKVNLLDYRTDKRLVGRIHPVYYHALFAGDAFGAFESFEGGRAKIDCGFVGDKFFVVVEACSDALEEDRLQLEDGTVVPARAAYERCPVCGIPVELGNLGWMPEEGKVIDRRTGEWLFIQGIGALNAVLRELEAELGEDIPDMVAELTWRYFSRLKEKHPQVFCDLDFMKMRGIGVPDKASPTPQELNDGVDIRNGFNGPILAGMVAAVSGGYSPAWTWEYPEEGVVRIKITS